CAGGARVDFMLKGDEIYVNEINTIPGSLAGPLYRSDFDFSKLIDKLIDIAKKRKRRADALKRTYTPVDPIAGK
ncbi:MAG: hypothetical protein K2M48_04400, partial [Clostridiales bacterium]|nr:hypothetical protein [Clostridiales bacterium]